MLSHHISNRSFGEDVIGGPLGASCKGAGNPTRPVVASDGMATGVMGLGRVSAASGVASTLMSATRRETRFRVFLAMSSAGVSIVTRRIVDGVGGGPSVIAIRR